MHSLTLGFFPLSSAIAARGTSTQVAPQSGHDIPLVSRNISAETDDSPVSDVAFTGAATVTDASCTESGTVKGNLLESHSGRHISS
jgi:hypothetical protein